MRKFYFILKDVLRPDTLKLICMAREHETDVRDSPLPKALEQELSIIRALLKHC
jgi:hypothetical protein